VSFVTKDTLVEEYDGKQGIVTEAGNCSFYRLLDEKTKKKIPDENYDVDGAVLNWVTVEVDGEEICFPKRYLKIDVRKPKFESTQQQIRNRLDPLLEKKFNIKN
jgi:hypothetical protein